MTYFTDLGLTPLTGDITVEMVINDSVITMELKGLDAPVTAANFVDLVERGIYNATQFHRLEPGFVAQGGDPQSKDPTVSEELLGTGGFIDPATDQERNIPLEIKPVGADEPIYSQTFAEAEITAEPFLPHSKGAIAMARTNDPDTASSQFYFALDDLPQLDGSYAVFGAVTEGMSVVENIAKGDAIQYMAVTGGSVASRQSALVTDFELLNSFINDTNTTKIEYTLAMATSGEMEDDASDLDDIDDDVKTDDDTTSGDNEDNSLIIDDVDESAGDDIDAETDTDDKTSDDSLDDNDVDANNSSEISDDTEFSDDEIEDDDSDIITDADGDDELQGNEADDNLDDDSADEGIDDKADDQLDDIPDDTIEDELTDNIPDDSVDDDTIEDDLDEDTNTPDDTIEDELAENTPDDSADDQLTDDIPDETIDDELDENTSDDQLTDDGNTDNTGDDSSEEIVAVDPNDDLSDDTTNEDPLIDDDDSDGDDDDSDITNSTEPSTGETENSDDSSDENTSDDQNDDNKEDDNDDDENDDENIEVNFSDLPEADQKLLQSLDDANQDADTDETVTRSASNLNTRTAAIMALGGDDQIQGTNNNDVINGNSGDDEILGADGNDFLRGGKGNDNVAGGLGNDFLVGDYGIDTLTGNEGIDNFILRANTASGVTTQDLADIITDFSMTDGDRISVIADFVTETDLVYETSGSDTILKLGTTGDILAVVKGATQSMIEQNISIIGTDDIALTRIG